MALAPAQNHPPGAGADQAAQRVKTGPERVLELVAIFASLTHEERKAIAAKLTPVSYDQGETLVEPGAVLHTLCIVGTGVLSFTREASDGEIELLRLGPGDHFGELGMLTGAPAPAKIDALLPTTIYELAKDDLAPFWRPARQSPMSSVRPWLGANARGNWSPRPSWPSPCQRTVRPLWFSERLHRLFDLASAE